MPPKKSGGLINHWEQEQTKPSKNVMVAQRTIFRSTPTVASVTPMAPLPLSREMIVQREKEARLKKEAKTVVVTDVKQNLNDSTPHKLVQNIEKSSSPSPLARYPNSLPSVYDAKRSALVFRDVLPIDSKLAEIEREVLEHRRVVMVSTPTGTGKSSRIPISLLHRCTRSNTVVWCCVPTRIAAQTMAARVQGEHPDVQVGAAYDRQVLYDTEKTQIRYVTTKHLFNVLVREFYQHKSDYTTRKTNGQFWILMLDEAHTTDLNTYITDKLIKSLAEKGMPLVISTATCEGLDLGPYSHVLKTINLTERLHPVQIVYSPVEDSMYTILAKGERQVAGPIFDLIRDLLTVRIKKCWPKNIVDYLQPFEESKEERGAMLVFLSGESEIETLYEMLMEDSSLLSIIDVRTVYSRAKTMVESEEDAKMIDPLAPAEKDKTKIVLTTNMCESGVTIPNSIVIDMGSHKSPFQRTGEIGTTLALEPCSQNSMSQRAGRTGRTRPGLVVRMMSEREFMSRPLYGQSEFDRMPPTLPCLELMRLGLDPRTIYGLDKDRYGDMRTHMTRLGLFDDTKGGLTPMAHEIELMDTNSAEQAVMYHFCKSLSQGEPVPVSIEEDHKKVEIDYSTWKRSDYDGASIAALLLISLREVMDQGILFYKGKKLTQEEIQGYYDAHFAEYEKVCDPEAYISLFLSMLEDCSPGFREKEWARWASDHSMNNQSLRRWRMMFVRLYSRLYNTKCEWKDILFYMQDFAQCGRKWVVPFLLNWVRLLGKDNVSFETETMEKYGFRPCYPLSNMTCADCNIYLDKKRTLIASRSHPEARLFAFSLTKFAGRGAKPTVLLSMIVPKSYLMG